MACIAMLPRAVTIQKREMDEQLSKAIEETDFSEPLRLKDFLKWKSWLKLARKWGAWKTASTCSILGAAIIAGVSYIVLSAFNMMNMLLVAGYTASATIIIFIFFHRQISKALKETKQSL
ncbi:MAG: hypothetical protein QW128_04425 [Thermoprotei archaeon]